MISYGVYRLLHFFGIFLLLTTLGGAVVRAMMGLTVPVVPIAGGADAADSARRLRRLIGISHGVALLLILVGGFGMLARLDIGMPGWIFGKLGVWLLLGGALAVANRAGVKARALWFSVPVLGLIAAWLAYTKPF